jgi:hypothetical protein
LSCLPQIQKEDDTKANTTFGIKHNERGQSHIRLASTFTIIILEPTFVPKLQPSPRIPTQLPHISLAILSVIQLYATSKPNPYTTASNQLSSATFANNIPNCKLINIPTKNEAKQSTSTSITKLRIFPASTTLPTFRTVHIITGGSNLTIENKRQKREHYRQVNHVAAKGPIVCTKWSHVQIAFTEADIKVTSVPHTDTMVITMHLDK